MRAFFEGLIDLVYPAACILCRNHIPASFSSEKEMQICVRCQNTVLMNRPPFCLKCSRPLANPNHKFCKVCQQVLFYFDQAWGTCLYNPVLRRLIHTFKYGSKTALRHYVARVMCSFINTYYIDFGHIDCLVSVPLHACRQRERGFNQSRLIAQMISENLDIPESCNNLIRVRHTQNQAVLSQKERWTNIQGAFKIKHPGKFYGKNVLIIDDLFTTGATTSEIARVLKAAGANTVDVLTLGIATEPKENQIHNPHSLS